jgi:tetratricopeptide (TPR) repeat protein
LNQEIRLNKLGATAVDKSANQEFINQSLTGFGEYAKSDMGRAIVISDFLLRAERYSDAQALVEEVLLMNPKDYQALEQLARLARFRSEFNVEVDYRSRIELVDPQNYNNYIALSEAYKGLGDTINAKVYAKKALALSNDVEVNQLANSILGQTD